MWEKYHLDKTSSRYSIRVSLTHKTSLHKYTPQMISTFAFQCCGWQTHTFLSYVRSLNESFNC